MALRRALYSMTMSNAPAAPPFTGTGHRLGMLLCRLRTILAAARYFSAKAAVKPAFTGDGKITVTNSGAGGRDTLGRRLLSLVYAKRSAVIAIRKWKEEGHTVRKYELNRIVRELRKHKRYKHALEV
ncbi:hypothetical protein U1Q18_020186 [Sarracenia purpurea var. burkii]